MNTRGWGVYMDGGRGSVGTTDEIKGSIECHHHRRNKWDKRVSAPATKSMIKALHAAMMKGKGKKKWRKKQVSAGKWKKNAYRCRTGWRLLVLFSGDVDNTLHMYLLKKKYAHCNTTVYLHHGITI